MEDLNDDIWFEIILLLELKDIISLNECSKYFNISCNSNILRNKLYQRFENDILILDDFSLKELEFYSTLFRCTSK